MSRRRVVVTGMGIVSPVGVGLSAAWDSIRNARSGVAAITRFDCSTFPTRIAAEVRNFEVGKYLSAKEARRYDTFVHYGLVATMDAVSDAGLDDYPGDKERVGVCIGSGIGGLPMIEDTKAAYLAGGVRKISPVLRARLDRQHGRRPRVDPLWLPGSQSRDRLRMFDGKSQHRRGGSADRVRRRRCDDRGRHRGDGQRARHRRLLRGARAVDPQRRSRDREPTVGCRPRRLRAGRRRRHPGAGGIRACEGARGTDLLRTRGLRDERRRASHHGAAGRWPWRRAQHAERDAQCRAQR